MKFKMAHYNLNVRDLDASLKFYKENFNMREVRRSEPESGAFKIVFFRGRIRYRFPIRAYMASRPSSGI